MLQVFFFAHFLSNHTLLVTHRESLIKKRFHFSSKGKGAAAANPLHRCVLAPASVSQCSALPACTKLKVVCMCSGTLPAMRDVTLSVEVMLTFFRSQKLLYSLGA